MIAVKVFALIALLAVASCSEEDTFELGRPSKGFVVPHHVSLRTVRNQHYCGGSLLSTRWILSTASCISHAPLNKPQNLNAWVGATSRTNGTLYKLQHFVRHPKFDPHTLWNNLALLHTAKTVVLVKHRVAVIVLPRKAFRNVPTWVKYVGFLQNREGPVWTQLTLTLHQKECIDQTSHRSRPSLQIDTSICAKNKPGVCSDTGSAVFNSREFIAVTSWSISCGARLPYVSTLVYPYLGFIRNTTGIHH